MSGPSLPLPIDAILAALRTALASNSSVVLEAPPGAGKTTRVPLALMNDPWLAGRRIVMLEPRRLAARMAATFMAESLGEQAGGTVGYRTRTDTRVGPPTRIEVVTEGILTRMAQRDPDLPGIGLVIFDEFHERSLQGDLGLALCLDIQSALRDDLKLLVMSATLDSAALAGHMGGAPVVRSEGRAWPVETRYLPDPSGDVSAAVASAVRRALRDDQGSILAFLPGEAEIRRTEAKLQDADLGPGVRIAPLYGALGKDAQDAAVRPAPTGVRKVVLATAIAETSLTIDGIAVVVDGGRARVPRFDPRSGLTRLETVRVSRAAAEQRRGRAGRLGPGVCYRLWAEAEQAGLVPFEAPEIMQADLAPLALDLARWGSGPDSLRWLDTPPAAPYQQARDLLKDLDALDAQGRLTAHGEVLAGLPLHPRLAHMAARGTEWGLGGIACDLAALLDDRDILNLAPGARDADIRRRLDVVAGHGRGEPIHKGALARARETAKRLRRTLKADGGAVSDAGRLLALAYPDRVAQRRPGGDPRYVLSGGRGAVLDAADPMASEAFLAVAELGGGGREGRIYMAAPLERTDIDADFADHLETTETLAWDERAEAVAARCQTKLGALVLDDTPLKDPSPGALTAAMIDGIRRMGLDCLPWTPELAAWRARVALLRRLDGDAWPDLSDGALMETLEAWLAPYLTGVSRRAHLARIDLAAALHAHLDWNAQRRLDDLAPTHLEVPSGSRYRLDYESGEVPVLAVKLQEMFGATETPTIAGGRVPVLIHLLSPAGRPLQVTQDLAAFWANGYAAVRGEMRGRYPKHPWPDDPLAAPPTRRTRSKMSQ